MQIGLLEAASQRRTESTMTKRKRTNTDLQDTHTERKLKIEQQEPHSKPGVNSGAPEGLENAMAKRLSNKYPTKNQKL
jgi:hypothetical protein